MMSGEEMESCSDGHHCFNGSKCVENPYEEGSFYCDCDEVVFEARYEGLYCEHKAEVYCVKEGASKHSFCTNGGTCQEYVGPDEAHISCQCPSEYEGPHCQFVKGTKPDGWPFSNKSTQVAKKKGSDAGAIIGSLVVILAGVIIGGAFVYKRYFTRGHTALQISKEFEFYGDNNKELEMNGNKNHTDRVKGQSSIEMNGRMDTVKEGQENGIV